MSCLARGGGASSRKLTQPGALYLYVYICIQAAVQHWASGSHCYGPGGMGQGAPFLVGPTEGTASAGHREVGPTSGLVVGPGSEAGGAGGPALLGTFFVGPKGNCNKNTHRKASIHANFTNSTIKLRLSTEERFIGC